MKSVVWAKPKRACQVKTKATTGIKPRGIWPDAIGTALVPYESYAREFCKKLFIKSIGHKI